MNKPDHLGRPLSLVLCLALVSSFVYGQQKKAVPPSSNAANNELSQSQRQAIFLIQQQIDEAGTLENVVSRIGVSVKAADAIWTFDQDNARKTLSDAYDLAVKHFHEHGQKNTVEGGMATVEPDQRFIVITAIARHDAAWAKRLSEQVGAETKREIEKAAKENVSNTDIKQSTSPTAKIGAKLTNLARSLLATDHDSAIALFQSTFNYPPAYNLPIFLFDVAKTNRAEADRLCNDALEAYSAGPLAGLFYLSPYIFPLNRPVGPTSLVTYYQPPEGFAFNPGLQQTFLSIIFMRGDKSLAAQNGNLSTADLSRMNGSQMPDMAQVYTALASLEPVVAEYQPSLIDRLVSLKNSLVGAMSTDLQSKAALYVSKKDPSPEDQFKLMLDKADQQQNPSRKDFYLMQAVQAGALTEDITRLEHLIDKISDADVHQPMLDNLYFRRAKKLVSDGKLDEATSLAKKVGQLDYRSNLLYDIAEASLKQNGDKARASEILNSAEADALKAPDTIEKARTLLGIAHLFTRFDQIRSMEVLSDAIKTINQVTAKTPQADFAKTGFTHTIQGKTFASYSSYQVSGFSIENAFAEAGTLDFDGVLLIARKLDEKVVRLQAIVALSSGFLNKKDKTE
ncbi:MAG TPA: hypothetical protein VFC63_02110 [Blastocatellia bacterium]|nr:hypothetical protein [Blastocatellia bacterium]